MSDLLYSRVRMLNDNYASDGVYRGTEGYVLEEYGTSHLEVEFLNPDKSTINVFSVRRDDVEAWPETGQQVSQR